MPELYFTEKQFNQSLLACSKTDRVYDNGHQSRSVLKILVKAYQPKISEEEDKRQLKLILKPVHFILTDCLSFILALCGIDCIAHGERCKLRSTCYDRLIIHCI